MKKFKDKIAQMWEDNPEQVIGLGIFAVAVGLKVFNAYSQHHRDVIWDREVSRREALAGRR